MEKKDILGADKIREVSLLYSLPVNELLWVQTPNGEVYRLIAINTYHVTMKSEYVYEVVSAVYIESHISSTIPTEIIIKGDGLAFNLETGTLMQEKDLLKAAFLLKQSLLKRQ